MLVLFFNVTNARAQTAEILIKLAAAPVNLQKSMAGVLLTTGSDAIDRIIHKKGTAVIRPVFSSPFLQKARYRTPESSALSRWLKITLPVGGDLDRTLASLNDLPQVETAQANRCFRLHYIPNDPMIVQQYALASIRAYQAWDVEQGDREIVVGVIDTGFDYNHPDLRENIWINAAEDLNRNGRADSSDYNGVDDDGNGFIDDVQGWDFTDAPNYPDDGDYREPDADPMDEMGHGTAVAGIIAAVTDNGIGMAGAAPHCRVMNLRSFTGSGLGEEDDAASAILYAIENGARIINMSWGDVFISRLLDDVIRYAAGRNVVLVASSGNSSTDRIHYPSAFEDVISVGASTADDNVAGFSNYGPSLDLVAPGSGILSITREARYDSSLNGTSFAAPFVAAAAALILSHDPMLPAESVRGVLTSSADDLGDLGWDMYYGSGRLNIERALGRPSGSLVAIKNPWLDQGFSGGPIQIWGSAWSATLDKYTLTYGVGHNPADWTEIVSVDHKRVIDGLLGSWQTVPSQDTSYTLRLQVFDRSGTLEQSAVRVFVDQSPPHISNVQVTPMLDGDTFCHLLGFETDDLCEGIIYWRPSAGNASWRQLETGYRGRLHQMLLSAAIASGKIELIIGARNAAGLETTDDQDGEYYTVDLGTLPINRVQFSPGDFYLPHGHMLDKGVDFNGDGVEEIVIGYFDAQNKLTTTIFGFDGSDYEKLTALPRPVIPRGAGDTDGDGRVELLCGYGFYSYLYEVSSPQSLTFDETVIWSDESTQYWAADLVDVDGDSLDEVIMRVVTSDADLFQVLKWDGDGSYTVLDEIPNPTDGENINGVPRCRTGDFDGDGYMEILLGDSDGDVYISEFNGTGFTSTWQDTLPLLDSIDYLSCGDYDGDGILEFVVGCHSDPAVNTEHYFDARHWLYRVYRRTGNDAYQSVAEWRFYGFESPKDFESGVSSGDVDGDGMDEMLFCLFPDFYMADYDAAAGYRITFHARPVQSNTAAILDADADGQVEFWISDGSIARPYSQVGTLSAPAVPVGLTAQPMDENNVRLAWYAVPGAGRYAIYRGIHPDGVQPFAMSGSPVFQDTSVVADQTYYYAVASVDSSKTPDTSIRSAPVSARPGARPYVVAAVMASMQSVRLCFSEPMNQSAVDPAHYRFSENLDKPTSCAMDASGREILLHLRQPFLTEGEYGVEACDLFDTDGTPLDTLRRSARFQVVFAQQAPYLVDGRLLDAQTIWLAFNEPMETASLAELSNYDMGEDLQIQSAEPQPPANDAVKLKIAASKPLGALGKTYTLRVRNVKNMNGLAMVPGYGDVLQLLFAAENLDKVFTYPNPYRVGLDYDGITFANLTPRAEIQIMTLQGYPLRTLYENNGDGGVTWDVRDDHGRPLASGIYLYRVVSGKMMKIGKLAIVR